MGFFEQYFIDPIVTQGVAGYNIFNTPVYAIGFALAVFGAYKLLQKLSIRIDRSFFIGIFPFIMLGGVLRVVRDSQIIPTPLLVSPLIYFSIFIIAVAGLLISVAVSRLAGSKGKQLPYHFTWAGIGWAAVLAGLALLAPLGINNWDAIALIAGISAAWVAAIFAVYRSRLVKWLSAENAALISVHMFDATTTFVALQFFATQGYYEQHVLSNFIIGFLGPAGQFVLKLAIVPAVLWAIDKDLAKPEQSQLRGFLKVAILILGLALGLRNMLRLVLGV